MKATLRACLFGIFPTLRSSWRACRSFTRLGLELTGPHLHTPDTGLRRLEPTITRSDRKAHSFARYTHPSQVVTTCPRTFRHLFAATAMADDLFIAVLTRRATLRRWKCLLQGLLVGIALGFFVGFAFAMGLCHGLATVLEVQRLQRDIGGLLVVDG